MSKKKTTTTQTNTGQFVTPPMTEQMTALQAAKAKADTSIPFNYGNQRQQLENSYGNPLGAYTSPAVRDAVRRNAGQRLAMNEGQAVAESQQAADNTNFQRQALVTQMTSPQYVSTGGTSTQTQQGGFWGDLLTSASQGALA